MEIRTISATKMCSTLINFVPVGTIAYLKTKDSEVRQVKLIKVEWVNDGFPRCEWKVAGMKEHQFGSWCALPDGMIYGTEFDAQHGSAENCSHKGLLCTTAKFNLYEEFEKSHGKFHINRFDTHGTWNDILSISTIKMEKDGTMPIESETPFCVEIDSDGVHAWIPSVSNGTRFLTKEAAIASYKPKKTITFEDEEDDDERCDIMDTHNSHNAELVRKINAAWKSGKYNQDFGYIVYSIAQRDYSECKEKFDCDMGNFLSSIIDDCDFGCIHNVLENVCDDQDLETILSFIRYEE
jgi:hypothetical protein